MRGSELGNELTTRAIGNEVVTLTISHLWAGIEY